MSELWKSPRLRLYQACGVPHGSLKGLEQAAIANISHESTGASPKRFYRQSFARELWQIALIAEGAESDNGFGAGRRRSFANNGLRSLVECSDIPIEWRWIASHLASAKDARRLFLKLSREFDDAIGRARDECELLLAWLDGLLQTCGPENASRSRFSYEAHRCELCWRATQLASREVEFGWLRVGAREPLKELAKVNEVYCEEHLPGGVGYKNARRQFTKLRVNEQKIESKLKKRFDLWGMTGIGATRSGAFCITFPRHTIADDIRALRQRVCNALPADAPKGIQIVRRDCDGRHFYYHPSGITAPQENGNWLEAVLRAINCDASIIGEAFCAAEQFYKSDEDMAVRWEHQLTGATIGADWAGVWLWLPDA